jgi:hypothetical protein
MMAVSNVIIKWVQTGVLRHVSVSEDGQVPLA